MDLTTLAVADVADRDAGGDLWRHPGVQQADHLPHRAAGAEGGRPQQPGGADLQAGGQMT